MRYTGGVTGYLEVLTTKLIAFSAELGLGRPNSMSCLSFGSVVSSIGRGLATKAVEPN